MKYRTIHKNAEVFGKHWESGDRIAAFAVFDGMSPLAVALVTVLTLRASSDIDASNFRSVAGETIRASIVAPAVESIVSSVNSGRYDIAPLLGEMSLKDVPLIVALAWEQLSKDHQYNLGSYLDAANGAWA
jgi:hypothetical protein